MRRLARSNRSRLIFALVLSSAITLLVLAGIAPAQSSRMTSDGYTPADAVAGVPAGSYALGGFDNVNLFNGKLNFSLPLMPIKGRGNLGFTLLLALERRWEVFRSYSASYPELYTDSPVDRGQLIGRYSPGSLYAECASSPVYEQITCNGTDVRTHFVK